MSFFFLKKNIAYNIGLYQWDAVPRNDQSLRCKKVLCPYVETSYHLQNVRLLGPKFYKP